MYLSDGENEAPPPLPDPSGGSMRTSSSAGGGKSPLLLKLKKEAIGNSGNNSSRGRSAALKSPPSSTSTTSTPTSATQRAAARKASGTRRRSSSRTRSASVDPSGRVATASYVRQSVTGTAASSSVSKGTTSSGKSKSKSGSRRTASSSAGINASSSRSIGSNGSGSASSVRSRSSSRSKTRSSSSSSPAVSAPPAHPSASARKGEHANTAAVAARGSDPPGPVATATRRSGGRGPSASSPGKGRIKKRAERERQRQLSLEEQRIVEAVQQQRVVAAVAASLMSTPPRADSTSGTAATASTTTDSTAKYVDQSPELARKPSMQESSQTLASTANDKKIPSPVPKYMNQSPELARREESSPEVPTGERKPIDIDATAPSPSEPSTIGDGVEAEVSTTNTGTNDVVEATKNDDNIEAADIVTDNDKIALSNEASTRMGEPNDAPLPTPSSMAKEETPEEVGKGGLDEKHETLGADNGDDVLEVAEEVPIEAKDDGDDNISGVPPKVVDNGDVLDTSEEKEYASTNDNIGNDVGHQDDESLGMEDTIQTVKSEEVDPKEAIAAALSLFSVSASIESDVSKSFESAEEGIAEEVVTIANEGAAPVELENGWTGTVTLQEQHLVTASRIEDTTSIKSKAADEVAGTNIDDVEGPITIPTETAQNNNAKITDIDEETMNSNQEEVESNENDQGEKPSNPVEHISCDLPSDSTDDFVPEPPSSAGSKRKEGSLQDEDIMLTPMRKKLSGLRVEVSDSAKDGVTQQTNPNATALASPSASELIEHFEAKSPKAGSHGSVPPSPRSAANKGGQGALSPSREPFRFGAPPSKALSNQLVVKTPPRHPPSRRSNAGSHATYDYPQRVQSPKWANSLSQSIAKGVCETQQSPRSNNESSGDTERILLEMKKMELRIEARMPRMEQHLEKQMRSKFKYLETRMDERMDEIQASLQVLLAKDITEI